MSSSKAVVVSILLHLTLFAALAGVATHDADDNTLSGVITIHAVFQEKPSGTPKSTGNRGLKTASKAHATPREHPGYDGGSQTLTIAPEYPRASRLLSEEGEVMIRAEVLTDGKVASVVLVKSSGYSRLDRAAKEAVASARYQNSSEESRTQIFKVVFQLE